ncbi:MAG: hypothetical protein AMXMBFR44_1120 [Candidatus Campbellbacteria bacterium]
MEQIKHRLIGALRWSEKYTKTDMVYLVGNSFWLTVGQGISSLASLALIIAFANLLPKETYGTYKFVLSVASVLSVLTLPRMNTAITQAVARGYEGSLFVGTKKRVIWGTFGAIVSFFVSLYYFLQGNTEIAIALLLAAAFLPIFDTFGTWNAYLQGKQDFKSGVIYTTVVHIASVTILFLTILATDSLLAIVFIYFLSYTLLRAFFFYLTVKKYTPNTLIDPSTYSYGKHLTAMTVLSTIVGQLDKILLFHFLGAAQVATYSIALVVPEQVQGMLRNVGVVAFPKFASQSFEDIKRNLSFRLAQYGLFITILTILYVFLAPFLFSLLFPGYSDGILLSQIVSLSLITALVGPAVAALEAQQKKQQLYMLRTLFPVIGIVLFLALVPTFGILGATLAFTTLNFSKLILSLFFLYRT